MQIQIKIQPFNKKIVRVNIFKQLYILVTVFINEYL